MNFNGREYPHEYVVCRVHHEWQYQGLFNWRGRVVAVSECVSCGSEIVRVLDKFGAVVDTFRHTAPNYTINRTKQEREKGIEFRRKNALKALMSEEGIRGDLEE